MNRSKPGLAPLLATLTVGLALGGCAAGDPRFTAEDPAGFWQGLWHGIISLIALIISLFSDKVEFYEANNTGWWYDAGFLLGIIFISGGGCSGAQRRAWKRRRRRRDEDEK